MAFPVMGSESGRTSVACGQMGDSPHESASGQICQNCVMQSCQHGPELVESMAEKIKAVLSALSSLTMAFVIKCILRI